MAKVADRMKKILTACLLAFLYPSLSMVAKAPDSTTARTTDLSASVVRIDVADQEPDYRTPWNPGRTGGGVGSGFVINLPGRGKRILTNAHVVGNARFITLSREGLSRPCAARIEFLGHDCDLAMIHPEDPRFFEGMKPLALGGLPEIESAVSVYGYPLGGERLSVTRGVVSRVSFDLYTHSGVDSHLVVQIDAAINPGNSGGPVLQQGKVVGVAFQGYSGDVAQNVGFMIPVPVIDRFLQDLSKGSYTGYMDLSLSYRTISNEVMRKALGLPDNDRGVLVTDVQEAGSSQGHLLRGDVLLMIDGLPISNDGRVILGGRSVDMTEVVERKFDGDSVRFDLLREGKPLQVSFPLKGNGPFRMQANSYDEMPRYLMHGGLVFQPLNRNLVDAVGSEEPRVRRSFEEFSERHLYVNRPEIVILSRILPDPVNKESDGVKPGIVSSINGRRIRSLEDVQKAFSDPSKRDVILPEGPGVPIVLDRESVIRATPRIMKNYGLTASSRP